MDERTTASGRKQTKLAEAWLGNSDGKPFTSLNVVHVSDDPLHIVVTYVEPPRRQYLTHSRVAASTSFGQQGRLDGVGRCPTNNSSTINTRHQSSKDSTTSSYL